MQLYSLAFRRSVGHTASQARFLPSRPASLVATQGVGRDVSGSIGARTSASRLMGMKLEHNGDGKPMRRWLLAHRRACGTSEASGSGGSARRRGLGELVLGGSPDRLHEHGDRRHVLPGGPARRGDRGGVPRRERWCRRPGTVLKPCDAANTDQTAQQCGQEFANDDSIAATATHIVLNSGPYYNALASSGKPTVIGLASVVTDYTGANAVSYNNSNAGRTVAAGEFAIDHDVETLTIFYIEGPSGLKTRDAIIAAVEPEGVEVEAVPVSPQATDVLSSISSERG